MQNAHVRPTSPPAPDEDRSGSGNFFDKYHSKNPIHVFLMRRFTSRIADAVAAAGCTSVLDVGCASGDLSEILFSEKPSIRYVGIDRSEQEIQTAAARYPARHFQVADARSLPFADNSFDLVMGCEILEHLEDPEAALREMARVSRRSLLVSVPWEPWWRVLNMLRGAYLSEWGNTPGHLGHFSRKDIRTLVSRFGTVILEKHPLPWTVLLAEKY